MLNKIFALLILTVVVIGLWVTIISVNPQHGVSYTDPVQRTPLSVDVGQTGYRYSQHTLVSTWSGDAPRGWKPHDHQSQCITQVRLSHRGNSVTGSQWFHTLARSAVFWELVAPRIGIVADQYVEKSSSVFILFGHKCQERYRSTADFFEWMRGSLIGFPDFRVMQRVFLSSAHMVDVCGHWWVDGEKSFCPFGLAGQVVLSNSSRPKNHELARMQRTSLASLVAWILSPKRVRRILPIPARQITVWSHDAPKGWKPHDRPMQCIVGVSLWYHGKPVSRSQWFHILTRSEPYWLAMSRLGLITADKYHERSSSVFILFGHKCQERYRSTVDFFEWMKSSLIGFPDFRVMRRVYLPSTHTIDVCGRWWLIGEHAICHVDLRGNTTLPNQFKRTRTPSLSSVWSSDAPINWKPHDRRSQCIVRVLLSFRGKPFRGSRWDRLIIKSSRYWALMARSGVIVADKYHEHGSSVFILYGRKCKERYRLTARFFAWMKNRLIGFPKYRIMRRVYHPSTHTVDVCGHWWIDGQRQPCNIFAIKRSDPNPPVARQR